MKRNIFILYAIALLQGMVFYGPVATLYRQAHGVSVLEITVIESISLALCILLEIPWGVVADRIGYRRTMIICSGLYFISKIVFWRADGFCGFLMLSKTRSSPAFPGWMPASCICPAGGRTAKKSLGFITA